ncbi:hypothetical protein KY290_033550 [Solanum tuberosum]|uniref:Uncharacterized protein n=1 Tax=Solanum tuberosum TaxID=4113 RepID=A0ABQ7U2I5_SOLTU|nr:hypothetical protein KY289_032910 [Solanum tuberosum]KAH0740507.1 hypothetical protein KY290_033550 [Solanum tuberosum]
MTTEGSIKDHFMKKCSIQYKGSAPSHHTGGSRTHRQHARQLATVLGRPPHPHELLKKTHTKRNDEFVDLKSKSTYDAVMSKITSASQLVDESGESPTWVGLGRHVYIYGLGSQAVFYENVGSSSASTSQPQDCSFDAQVKEYVQEMKEEMKHEMRGDERIDTT